MVKNLDWIVTDKPTRASPKRILFLAHEFEAGGGISTYVRSAKKALGVAGHEVDIIVKPVSHGFRASFYSSNGERKESTSLPQLLSQLDPDNYDVLHFNSLTTTTDYDFDLHAFLRGFDCPAVYTAHSSILEEMIRLQVSSPEYERARRAQHELLKIADLVIAPNHSHGHDLQREQYLLGRKLRVVPNTVEDHSHNPSLISETVRWIKSMYAPNGEQLLIYSGRISHEKGVRTLASAYEIIKKEHKNARLVFVGEGPLIPQLKEIMGADDRGMVSDGNGRKYAPFVGYKQGADLVAYYAVATAMIAPSFLESFCLSAAESLLIGTPVIISDLDGPKEYFIEHGFAYPIRDPKSIDSLVSAVDSCFAELGSASQLRRKNEARDYVRSEFSFPQFANRLNTVYEEAITRREARKRVETPSSIVTANNAATTHLAQGEYRIAANIIEELLEKGVLVPWLSFNYAHALMGLKEYQGACWALEQEITINPESHWVHAQLAYCYARTGSYEKAHDHIETAQRKMGRETNWIVAAVYNGITNTHQLAQVYIRDGRLEEARNKYLFGLMGVPNDNTLQIELSKIPT